MKIIKKRKKVNLYFKKCIFIYMCLYIIEFDKQLKLLKKKMKFVFFKLFDWLGQDFI